MNLSRLYEQLEFDRLLKLVAGHCQSEAARRKMESWRVSFRLDDIERNLNETTEAIRLLEEKSSQERVDFASLPENLEFLGRFQPGVLPEQDDLKLLGDLLTVISQAGRLLAKLTPSNFPTITSMLAGFANLDELAKAFTRTFTADGEVKDSASPDLRLLRGRLSRLQLQVENRIRTILKSRAPESADELHLSIRNNRLTVNLPVGMLRSFKGLIVDYSASGASVYVEPEEVVGLNNQRQELFFEEETEVRRILQRFSEDVAKSESALRTNHGLLVCLDLILGRARYSRAIGGQRPELSHDGEMHLTRARHPLMLDDFVPETVSFGAEKQLIISGVNAGGKSLLLKMMGLFVLMAYSGILIPTDRGSAIGLFDSVWVDITDEQSVLNNLSTFTAHLGFLQELFAHLAAKPADAAASLVLIDELGTGTDPEEGAALGYALMEHLLAEPAKVAVTTHYDLIKTLGENEPACKNVSLGFDEATLTPTYEVLEDIPGKSFAFDLASGLGFSREILERARRMVATGESSFADAVQRLREKQAEVEREKRNLEAQRDALHTRENDLGKEQEAVAKREAELRKRLEALRRDFEKAADTFLEKARQEINQRIRSSKGKTSIEVGSKFSADFRKEKENLLANLERALGLTPLAPDSPIENLAVGAHVDLPSIGVSGEVVRLDERKGKLQVVSRGKRITLDLVNVRKLLLEAAQPGASSTGATAFSSTATRKQAKLGKDLDASVVTRMLTTAQQLDLHGHTKDEALPKLEKFISDAIYRDFDTVMIMHGVGSGALRAFVRDYLKRSQYVAAFRDASTEEGGKGTTIVDMK